MNTGVLIFSTPDTLAKPVPMATLPILKEEWIEVQGHT
jgi:hypothetical protein